VKIVLQVPDSPLLMRGDARRLGQAVDNLVSNAVKFTPAGGSVTISARSEVEEAVVAVADTGMGIPPEELTQLSERFFRTKMATRQAIQGVGLGLSITKAIAAAHGGTLSASSTVGEGTVFEMRIPTGL
jgi:signal transduction histidine kinase